jgi:hypothetical protein
MTCKNWCCSLVGRGSRALPGQPPSSEEERVSEPIDANGAGERWVIHDLLCRYTFALDSHDWESLRGCFTDDAVADLGEFGRYEGMEAIIASVRGALGGLDASQHLLGNVVASVDGEQATATSYVQAQHVAAGDDGPLMATVGATYRDRLVRTAAGWRITHRKLETSWRAGGSEAFAAAGARHEAR